MSAISGYLGNLEFWMDELEDIIQSMDMGPLTPTEFLRQLAYPVIRMGLVEPSKFPTKITAYDPQEMFGGRHLYFESLAKELLPSRIVINRMGTLV